MVQVTHKEDVLTVRYWGQLNMMNVHLLLLTQQELLKTGHGTNCTISSIFNLQKLFHKIKTLFEFCKNVALLPGQILSM